MVPNVAYGDRRDQVRAGRSLPHDCNGHADDETTRQPRGLQTAVENAGSTPLSASWADNAVAAHVGHDRSEF